MNAKPAELHPTRWSLVHRLKNWDDRESWKDFFDAYWKLIYSVALKAGLSDTEAEEVVQETVITVAKKIGSFQADPARGSFKGWLLTMTRWRIADQFRKRPREHPQRADDGTATNGTRLEERVPDPHGCELESIWQDEWQKNLMDVALERTKRRVKARQYQIYYLYGVKGLSAAQVAHSLGVNTAQVHLAKHRVGALLKKELQALETQFI